MKNEKYKKIFDIVCDIVSFILIFLFFIPIFQFFLIGNLFSCSTLTKDILVYYKTRYYLAPFFSFILSLILNFRIVKRILKKFNLIRYKRHIRLFLIIYEVAFFYYVMFIF